MQHYRSDSPLSCLLSRHSKNALLFYYLLFFPLNATLQYILSTTATSWWTGAEHLPWKNINEMKKKGQCGNKSLKKKNLSMNLCMHEQCCSSYHLWLNKYSTFFPKLLPWPGWLRTHNKYSIVQRCWSVLLGRKSNFLKCSWSTVFQAF